MLLSLGKNGLTSLFKEVRVFKVFSLWWLRCFFVSFIAVVVSLFLSLLLLLLSLARLASKECTSFEIIESASWPWGVKGVILNQASFKQWSLSCVNCWWQTVPSRPRVLQKTSLQK